MVWKFKKGGEPTFDAMPEANRTAQWLYVGCILTTAIFANPALENQAIRRFATSFRFLTRSNLKAS